MRLATADADTSSCVANQELEQGVKSAICNRWNSLFEGQVASATSNTNLTTGIRPQRPSQRQPSKLRAAGTPSPGGPTASTKSASTTTDSKSGADQ